MKCPKCKIDVKMQKRPTNNNTCLWCSCGATGEGVTQAEAEKNFLKNFPAQTQALMELPKSAGDLQRYMQSHVDQISLLTMPFVSNDKSALQRMIDSNIRYVTNIKDKAFLKCWASKEGQESIIQALEEAFSLGASLPEMGCLISFNGIAEFVPAVEAYEFALCNGNNSPFEWIQIEPIFSNDKHVIKRINGEFHIELETGSPRGELILIAVYGKYRKSQRIIGEVYDKERLLEKAKQHSSSYQYYLDDLNKADYYRAEGKIKKEGNREYFIKTIGQGDNAWEKNIYLDEITNPYINADQPEMLRKAAGKSFLNKFARTRKSEAAINEVKESVQQNNGTVESVIDTALQQSVDAIVVDDIPPSASETQPEQPAQNEPSKEEPVKQETAKKEEKKMKFI